jgi:hypothetical protein
MTTIAVDPERLAASAGYMARTQGEVLAAADAAWKGLAGCGGMAGNDPAGAGWSEAYDPAAARLLELAAGLANRLGSQVRALNEAAAAYHASEAWFGSSAAVGPSTAQPIPAQAHTEWSACAPPQAQGGPPFAHPDPVVQAVVHLVGTVWPNGDAERLRTASARWDSMASTLDAARGTCCSPAADCLESMSSPAVSAALARSRELDGALGDLHGAALELATACRELAHHVDETHRQVQEEVRNLLLDTAITAAVSAGLSFITFGAGALVGGAAATVRVTAAATRLGSLFHRLTVLARAVAAPVTRLKSVLDGVAARLAAWATARLPRPVRRIAAVTTKAPDHWLFTLATDGPAAGLGKLLEKRAVAAGRGLGRAGAERALVAGWRYGVPGVRNALTCAAASGGRSARHAVGPATRRALAGRTTAEALAHAENSRPAQFIGRVIEKPTASAVEAVAKSAAEGPVNSASAPGESASPSSEATGPGAAKPGPADGEPRAGGSPLWAADLRLPGTDGVRIEIPQRIALAHGIELSLEEGKVKGPWGAEATVKTPGQGGKLADSGMKVVHALTDADGNWWKQHINRTADFHPLEARS